MKQRKPLPKGAVYGLIAGAALFVALVGYLLLIKGQKDHLASIKSELNNTRQTIDTFRAEVAASKPGAKPRIRVADIYRLARAMPTSAGMADIVLELNAVAQTTGVAIDGISPQTAADGNGFEIVPINITFHGNFYATTDFLYRLRALVNVRHGQLEAGGRLFAVDKMTLTPTSDDSLDLSGTATLQTFVYGATASATAAVPPPVTSTTATTSTSAEGAP